MFSLGFFRNLFHRRPHTVVNRASRKHDCRPQIEELETRLVLSAKVGLANGVLRAVANNSPTTVTLRQAGGFTILNGVKAPTRALKRIEIVGGGAGDTVLVQSTPAGKPVSVRTGGGNDVIHVGSGANLLSGIQGNLIIDGGAGRDALILHDAADPTGQSFTVAADSVVRSGAARIAFSPTTEGLSVLAGAGNDEVHVLSNPAATKLTLNGGGGINILFSPDGNGDALVHRQSTGLTSLSNFDNVILPWTRNPVNLAVKLDRDLDLVPGPLDWQYVNWGGRGEKWVLDSTERTSYFILPDGELYRWDSSSGQQAVGELVATLDPSFHADVHRLTQAERLLASGQIAGPAAELAARLDHDLGLHVEGEDAWLNYRGRGEKWLQNAALTQWYFILPGGEFYRCDGPTSDIPGEAKGELLATLDPSFYQNLSKLTEAKEVFGDLDLQALAAIQKRHAEEGGDAGRLGAAVTGLQLTPDGRAWYVDYEHGAIYLSWWDRALVLDGGNWQEYQAAGRHDGGLGLPREEPAPSTRADTLVARYENGAVYYSPATGAHAVYGPVYLRYGALHQERGELGLPTSGVTVSAEGGRLVTFERGALYSHPDGRLLEVRDGIYARWLREGGAAGELGYPTGPEQRFVGDPYRCQSFQHGSIFWEAATGRTIVVKGLINGKWLNRDGMTGPLGAPVNEEELVPGGVLQRFQSGAVYYKWGGAEAFEVHDDISDRYDALGGAFGLLGLPTSDQFVGGDGWSTSHFENGTILWRGDAGVHLSFDRAEMLRLFARVSQDGVVDEGEMNFLRTIVADPGVFMPDYVRNLANKVVNGDVANNTYRGEPLGNLAAGSSGGQMDRLVGKWFRGEGGAAWAGGSYDFARGALFGPGGPKLEDIDQGGTGDCYFLASLGAVLGKHPDNIRDMFIDNGDGTFTVRFFRDGRPEYVTVDRWFPAERGLFVFANHGQRVDDPNAVLWAALAEKAYAQLNESGWTLQDGSNTYEGIESGQAEWAMSHITGRWSDDHRLEDVFNKFLDDMINDWRGGKSVVLNSESDADDVENPLVVAGHSYTLVSVTDDNQGFWVYNPWGVSNEFGTDLHGYVFLDRHDILVNFHSWTWGD